ncbi:MAG TPA: histidine phosphatase family protein [Blastocatellia bacterium]|nr:histidine phosphatase family protein [Blastocatellia bacterium]
MKGLSNGFLITEFIAGRPLSPRDADHALLDHVARYPAFLRRSFPAERGAEAETLREMIQLNVAEGLGPQLAARLRGFEKLKNDDDPAATALDGRLFPHEWLRAGERLVRTDGVEHHADHFLPGSQDIAWDVAGCCVEFGLESSERAYLISQYQACSRDDGVAERLPLMMIAYLSFRPGYTTLAAAALEGAPDAARFDALVRLRQAHANELIAVVSHGDVIRAAVTYYAGIPLDLFQRIEIGPASVSVVEVSEYGPRLLRLNDTGSLF